MIIGFGKKPEAVERISFDDPQGDLRVPRFLEVSLYIPGMCSLILLKITVQNNCFINSKLQNQSKNKKQRHMKLGCYGLILGLTLHS